MSFIPLSQCLKLRFFRLFKTFRELEKDESYLVENLGVLTQEKYYLQKKVESDAAMIKSLNRHVGAMEGRDVERLGLINELESQCKEYRKTIKELRRHLLGIPPG